MAGAHCRHVHRASTELPAFPGSRMTNQDIIKISCGKLCTCPVQGWLEEVGALTYPISSEAAMPMKQSTPHPASDPLTAWTSFLTS